MMLYGFGMLVNGVWGLYRRLLTKCTREAVDGGRGRKTDRLFKTWAEKKSQLKVFIAILL